MKILPISAVNSVYKGQKQIINKDAITKIASQEISTSQTKQSFFSRLVSRFFKKTAPIQNEVLDPIKETASKAEQNHRHKVDARILELEEIIDNDILVEEFFKMYPDIDINSTDSDGLTLLLRAVNRGDGRFICKLEGIHRHGRFGKIDWNAVDKNGNNAYMLERKRTKNERYDSLIYTLSGWIKPDYINPKTKMTVLQQAIVEGDDDFIGSFCHSISRKDNRSWFDIDKTHPETPPTSILAVQKGLGEYRLNQIFEFHPDLDAEYDGKTLYDYIDKIKSYKVVAKLRKHLFDKKLAEFKAYSEKEGSFSLQQISDIMSFPDFLDICEHSINDIGENLGHFIAEIYPKDFNEIKKISELIDKIPRTYIFKLNSGNITGRTPAEKALEAHNNIVLKLFLQKLPHRDITYYDSEERDFARKLYKLVEKSDIDDKEELLKLLRSKY